MPFEMPIFPLGVVLFPGMPLPLHIFEPRYRLMISRCLEADRTFGVALLVDGEEGQSDTVPATVGCSAHILEAAELDDGRYNLQALGERRFRILGLREQDDYLVGNVQWLDDEPEEIEAARLANQALRSLRRYLGAIGSNLGASDGAFSVPGDAHALSLWIAALLATPNVQKQALLETTSTAARLKTEVQLLQRAEVVQAAWTRRQTWPDSPTDAPDPAQFFSLN